MKKFFSVCGLLLMAAPTLSQPTDSGTAQSFDIEGERSRIQADRVREEAHYGLQDAACYARFAVTDCLREVRVRRHEALDNLRRQEVALNDAERKRKAQEQIEKIQEKSSAQRSEEAVVRRAEAQAAQQERQERANQKTAAALNAKSGATEGKSAPKQVEEGRKTNDAANEKNQYDDKLRQAQEHRASREKSNNEKSGPSAKPLPTSP